MYRRILLAYDGSIEGRVALREGALLAKRGDAPGGRRGAGG
jgi:nucleotide-binding universal stress UspA family protein